MMAYDMYKGVFEMIDFEKVKKEFIENYKGELVYLEDFNVLTLQNKCKMLYEYALSSPLGGFDEYICFIDNEGDKRVKRKFFTPNYCLIAVVDIYNKGNDEQPIFFDLLKVHYE